MSLLPLVARCALLVLLALGGCAGEPERPPEPAPTDDDTAAADTASPPVNPFAEPARRALRIELGLDSYRTIEGTWTAGDAASTFTAHFAGDTLRFIEEEMSLGDYGTGTNVFYFEQGALFYAVQNTIRVRLGRAESARRDTSRLRLALTPSGDVLASEQTVNGTPEAVRETTTLGVRNHAEALRDRAHELQEETDEPTV